MRSDSLRRRFCRKSTLIKDKRLGGVFWVLEKSQWWLGRKNQARTGKLFHRESDAGCGKVRKRRIYSRKNARI